MITTYHGNRFEISIDDDKDEILLLDLVTQRWYKSGTSTNVASIKQRLDRGDLPEWVAVSVVWQDKTTE